MDNSPENIAFLCRKDHKAAHRLGDGKVGGGQRPRVTKLMHDRAVVAFREAGRLRALGWSNARIADLMGVHPVTVSRWFHKYADTPAEGSTR